MQDLKDLLTNSKVCLNRFYQHQEYSHAYFTDDPSIKVHQEAESENMDECTETGGLAIAWIFYIGSITAFVGIICSMIFGRSGFLYLYAAIALVLLWILIWICRFWILALKKVICETNWANFH